MEDSTVEPSAGPKLPPNAGKGRVKGVPNKVTRELKEMISEALEGAGGVDYLIAKADTHPAAFLALVGRILPLQVTGKVEHEHTGGLHPETQRLVDELRGLGRRHQEAAQASLPH